METAELGGPSNACMRERLFPATAGGSRDVGMERSSAELSRRARHQPAAVGGCVEVVVIGAARAEGIVVCDFLLPAFLLWLQIVPAWGRCVGEGGLRFILLDYVL